MKLAGQVKPRRFQLGKINPKGWQFRLLGRSLTRSRVPEAASMKASDKVLKDNPRIHNVVEHRQSC